MSLRRLPPRSDAAGPASAASLAQLLTVQGRRLLELDSLSVEERQNERRDLRERMRRLVGGFGTV